MLFDDMGPVFTQPGTIPKSPFQDLSAGSKTAQSVSAFKAANPTLWGNLYADIQSGQMRIGKYVPVSWNSDESGNVTSGGGGYYTITDAEGNPTQWTAYEVPNNPNAFQLTIPHGDYIQNMVVGTDPATGYISPITDNSKQVEFHRWNYDSGGLKSMLQNPIVPLMANALLPGAGSAIGSALVLGEGALASAVGSGVMGGGVSAVPGGDVAQGALSGALGSLVSDALATPQVESTPVFEVAELPTEQLLNDYAAAASNAIIPEVVNQPAQDVVVNPVSQGSVSESPLPALPDVIPDVPVETPQVSASISEPAATQTPVFSEVMELPTEDLLKQYDSVVPSVVDTKQTVKQPEVFSEIMELPTEDLLNDYSNAALPPVEDLSTSSGTPFSNPTISDIAAGAALGGATGAVAGNALESLIPEIPAMPTYTPPKNNPDYTKKFDAPVQWGEVPTWDFTVGTEASPYLSQSQAGQFTGQMLFDPSQAYASGLLQGLRSSSNAPGAKNAGFTLFNTTK